MQLAAPESEKNPGAQGVHTRALPEEYVPAAQAVHVEAPPILYSRGAAVMPMAAGVSLKVPAGHVFSTQALK